MPMEIDDRRFRILMQIAYDALIEDIHQRTERMLRFHYGQRKLQQPFIPPEIHARDILLPSQGFYRRLGNRTWGGRTKLLEQEYNADKKAMADLVPLASFLEAWFEETKEADMQESVDEFLGRNTKQKAAKVSKKR